MVGPSQRLNPSERETLILTLHTYRLPRTALPPSMKRVSSQPRRDRSPYHRAVMKRVSRLSRSTPRRPPKPARARGRSGHRHRPGVSAESYLSIERLIAAARESGADAVHPGYGFLAERAAFAEAVEQAELIFVGPPPAAIRAMGDKTEARRRMQEAGVPIVPGGSAPVDDLGAALAAAEALGYPVMVKAAAGGGGKGMRVVRDADALSAALDAAHGRREAIVIQAVTRKFIEHPRHIESQVLADGERTIHLGRGVLISAPPEAVRRRFGALTVDLREWMAHGSSAAQAVATAGGTM